MTLKLTYNDQFKNYILPSLETTYDCLVVLVLVLQRVAAKTLSYLEHVTPPW